MSVRLKAIYRDGAFIPIPNGEKLNVLENVEVEITADQLLHPQKEYVALYSHEKLDGGKNGKQSSPRLLGSDPSAIDLFNTRFDSAPDLMPARSRD